ncbi:hypothetical protein AVEN_107273-1, partial [Araneus ventricosus]
MRPQAQNCFEAPSLTNVVNSQLAWNRDVRRIRFEVPSRSRDTRQAPLPLVRKTATGRMRKSGHFEDPDTIPEVSLKTGHFEDPDIIPEVSLKSGHFEEPDIIPEVSLKTGHFEDPDIIPEVSLKSGH